MDYREMTQLAGDPDRLRAFAQQLLKYADEDLGEGSRKFLAEMAAWDGQRRLGVAALEALHGLRERAKRYRKLGPYPVAGIVAKAQEARLDLDDDEAEAFIVALFERGRDAEVTRSEALRLLALARQLDLIAAGEWIDL